MAANRRKLKLGIALTAVVIVAVGVGIGTANAGTRGPWHSSKPARTAPRTAPTKALPTKASPAVSSAAPSATSSRTASTAPSAPASPVTSASASASATSSAAPGRWTPPPANATFDYQIGGAYTPPSGTTVVSRDSEATPAAGIYDICYLNAFQAQPGAESWWKTNHPDLLLHDKNGELVVDEDWDELMLDFSTEAKRTALTGIVGGWIDRCAAKGFQAVEPDNLDSYTRSGGLLTQTQAIAYVTSLASRAHAKGLAIGQKNTAELSSANARKAGLDFAVAEECADFDECDAYTASYGDNVIVIEYSRSGFAKACKAYGSRLSIVLRDVDVTTPGSESYVHEAC
ncbi:endo alpha-1,4 polygalactosaminidase [Actinoplanes sp. NPDC049802]|uniref:endo alpha-1,4 polygalactosaminidase n=1 Tax=Actinoplanes sp. NPDC049802 TaxID=3154742 RepID=UPI003403E191